MGTAPPATTVEATLSACVSQGKGGGLQELTSRSYVPRILVGSKGWRDKKTGCTKDENGGESQHPKKHRVPRSSMIY